MISPACCVHTCSRACGGGEQRAQGTRARGSWNVFKEWSLRSVGWACRFTVGRHHIVDIFLTWLSRKPRAAGGGVKWCPAARTTGVRWVASALPVRCSHGGCRLGDACPRPSLDPRCRTPTGSSQAPWRWGCTTQAPQTMCEDWMRDLMHSLEGELSRCLDAKVLRWLRVREMLTRIEILIGSWKVLCLDKHSSLLDPRGVPDEAEPLERGTSLNCMDMNELILGCMSTESTSSVPLLKKWRQELACEALLG
ncbi:uncharacterized protein [Lolium perenne]|uniref:uncharacterized protein isoform X1 n=1 Tax=Lolium perenne TaxID=4522 RepID=UPI003A9A2BE8